MPSTGEKKREQMRAYYKTPAGIAAYQSAYAKVCAKHGRAIKTPKPETLTLQQALSIWR